jgi:hypothetical protein
MPIASAFQDETLLLCVVGEYPRGQIAETIIAAYSDPRFTSETAVLIDAREAQADPSAADVRDSARRILGQRPAGHVGKWAILVRNDPLQFGLARMAALTMESLGVSMGAFTDMDAALTYPQVEE